MTHRILLLLLTWSVTGIFPAAGAPSDSFAIAVLDEQTGRGVPLVELKTVSNATWWTDSNGLIAFDETGLMQQEVYFHVLSHGYEYPKDGFGNRGVKLRPTPGGKATVKLKRLNIAERLYRITGEGIYRDTVRLGRSAPTQQPLLNGQVLGQDTVIVTPYREKLYWFWGDTERVSYPLGNFGASGATSAWPGRGGLDPAVGVDLTYFTDASGFSKPMVPVPKQGLRWIEGLFTVPGEDGRERLVARVANHRDLGHVNGWHLMVFNDEKEIFEPFRNWNITNGHDSSHPFRARVGEREYFYLYPNWRVPATLESLADLGSYEALTCVAGDGTWRGAETKVNRNPAGRVSYSWKAGAERLHPGRVRDLVASNRLKPEEDWMALHDLETGNRIQAGRGSVYWNVYRKRWILLTSAKAGEIWFAEGDTPSGPWVYARRVLSHDDYNFYNPTHHPFFDQDRGRLIYFEGTYTASFSKARQKTPRYDYNQMMYRLALDDARLALPVPVYLAKGDDGKVRYGLRDDIEGTQAWRSVEEVSFFALDPTGVTAGSIPIFAEVREGGTSLSRAGSKPLFFARPAAESEFPMSVLLYEFEHPDGARSYSTQAEIEENGVTRRGKPLCRVWRNPMKVLVLDPEAKPVLTGQ